MDEICCVSLLYVRRHTYASVSILQDVHMCSSGHFRFVSYETCIESFNFFSYLPCRTVWRGAVRAHLAHRSLRCTACCCVLYSVCSVVYQNACHALRACVAFACKQTSMLKTGTHTHVLRTQTKPFPCVLLCVSSCTQPFHCTLSL